MNPATLKPIVRPHVVRVMLGGRRCIFGRYVSLKAAHCERAKLTGLGWIATVESEKAVA